MTRRWSLRQRLAIGLSGGIIVLWLAATVTAGVVLKGEIDELFDSALQEVAQRVLPLAYSELLTRESEGLQQVAPIGRHHEYISYVVRDAAGNELLQSSDAEALRIPKGLAAGFTTTEHFRLYTESAVQGTVVVTTAEAIAHRSRTIRSAVGTFVWPLVALVPLAFLVVWLSVQLALKPVDRFRLALEGRGRGNLSAIGASGLPDEIEPVRTAANGLIERLRGALEAERSFTANSAHELRTPIAAALAQTQRLIAELPAGATRGRALAISNAMRRLTRLSEKLLQLAKAEGGGLIAPAAAPLAPILRLVVDELMREHDLDDRLKVSIDETHPALSDVDPDAFAILARNLIENALKHGAADEPVEVTLAAGVFEVINGGPPVREDTLALLTRPFERGPTKSEGSGLGLAIASTICRGAGLQLHLSSPVKGRTSGFQVLVQFALALPQA